ncbi:MAG: multidrug efflux SMR transporter [Betaproteobacteria bacterium]|nr:MAG: multidrug efflux SMR transporter [Betaproteobacteria bacterium]
MAWAVLLLAGLLEIGWALGLKSATASSRPALMWSVTLAAMAASVGLLARALKQLPLGLAYAVWTAIGIAGTALVGIFLLGESASPLRLCSIGLILAGVAGLKLSA